jgi:ribosomal protein S18 acetylase RimI-like enzyme
VACTEKRNAEIASLAVHPDYRRQGVGDALMRRMLREL